MRTRNIYRELSGSGDGIRIEGSSYIVAGNNDTGIDSNRVAGIAFSSYTGEVSSYGVELPDLVVA